MDALILKKPDSSYSEQIKDFRREFIAEGGSMDGCGSLRRFEDPADWLRQCEEFSNEDTLPAGSVPITQYICVREKDNRMVGVIQIRHRFNEYFEKYAGHIGYSVRHSERRRGYAGEMLRQCLEKCAQIGLERVLISCIDGNIGSEKVILSNGEYMKAPFLNRKTEYI